MSKRHSSVARVVIPFPAHRRGIATDLSGLLAAIGCADIDELCDLVDGDCEPDMWVAGVEGSIEIGSGVRATLLAFPFPVAEFWAVVDEVEQQEIEFIEEAYR
jgi:hypothetical protein